MNAYDRMIQREAKEWFDSYDDDTTEGYLCELTGEPFEEDDEIICYNESLINKER